MKGEWIQAASGTWHLIWRSETREAQTGEVRTWCARVFQFDDPIKIGTSLSFEDILHDECVRKSETM